MTLDETNAGVLMRASYLPLDQAAEVGQRRGYTLDRDLSSDDTMVFVDKKGVPTVAHRGSTTAHDWLVDDTLIAVGRGSNTARSLKAQNVTWQAEMKYKKPANAVGHSLGGRLAEESMAGGRIYTLNKAAGLGDVFKRTTNAHRQTDLRTPWDPVSALSLTQRGRNTVKTIPTKREKTSGTKGALMALAPMPVKVAAGVGRVHSAKNL